MREPADIKDADKHVYFPPLMFMPVINNESNGIVQEQPAVWNTLKVSEHKSFFSLLPGCLLDAKKKLIAVLSHHKANTPISSHWLTKSEEEE